MKNHRLAYWLLFSFTILSPFYLSAQASNTASIEGIIMDEQSNQPIPYASVQLFDAKDSSLITGTITEEEGQFRLECPYGNYTLRIDFMGYKSEESADITLSNTAPSLNMGTIQLKPADYDLDEVVVQAEKSTMELSLDKKVFNVGKDLASAGTTATEILGNIPAVTVDTEGNVRLRGSSEVRILIDGKPSGLVSFKGGAGLAQLQGSLIEKVEVITNPSARYEAEGMAGIINIVLKKQGKKGLNGSFELITGNPANYGASANINYRYKAINFFLNYGITYRVDPNRGSVYQEIYNGDTTLIQLQQSEGQKEGLNNNIQGGLDYYFNDKNILTASYRFQRSDATRTSDVRYEDYLFNLNNFISVSTRRQDEDEQEPYSEYVLSFKRLFEKKGQEFNFDARYLNYWENSDQLYTETFFAPGQDPSMGEQVLERSVNDEFENQYLIQIDYTHPVGKEGKIETGLRSSFRDMTNDFTTTIQDEFGAWQTVDAFDNIFQYDEQIHAAYGIIGNKTNKFSYQAGLRAELTDVKTVLEKTNEINPRTYSNLFPSAHLTYDLPKDHALQLSYSRRVRRPVYWDLSPFVTLFDRRNFFSGNPDLDPEFSNSFELGHLKYFDKGSVSSTLFYRKSIDAIVRIREVDDTGTARTIPQNINGQDAYGLDFAWSYLPYKWWKLDASFNFYRASADATNIDASYSSNTYSWFIRQTSKFNLPNNLSIQFRGNYQAPEVLAQGKQKSIYFFDISFRKELFRRKGWLSFNVLDIFNSRKTRAITRGVDWYTNRTRQWSWRRINLTLSYKLNQGQ